MDKDYTETNIQPEQKYIVSLDNGIRREEPITMEVFNNFKDGSQLVQLNNNVFGVFKSNSLTPNTMYIDDYDIIKSDIAELFDVDHEETKRIVTEDKNIGVFTLLNYSKDIETRISATTVINHMLTYLSKGIIPEKDATWLTKVLEIPIYTKGNGIKDHDTIEEIIKLGLYALIKEIELQTGTSIDTKIKRAIEKKYLRMILFDYIIGRKYRGLDYCLISKQNEYKKPVWSDAYLSPISVSNSIDKDNLVGDNEYILNNKLINRTALINTLYERFYPEIRKMTEAINDAKKLYIDAVIRIIYNNTDIDHAASLEDEIIKNIQSIAKMQKDKESKLAKEEKTNKVERTMATQSINVRVTTKLDLIQKKYPINPKDHPELLKEQKKQLEQEDVKLVVEEEKKNQGFATFAILIAAISLICGIGIGIAYVLLTFGN
ncbi:MAG TPA: hypothetical protein IAC02_07490 [Candidatus Coprovivens excrementavium]|nr:hypothetical protein [Candidatus Coprovivens excrementavium]